MLGYFSGTMELCSGESFQKKPKSFLSLLELMFHSEIEEFPHGDVIPRVQP